MTGEPVTTEETTKEEMQGYIYALNARIVQNDEVSDDEITKALLYQRALNQHNLEKKERKTKKPKAPVVKLNLEDL